MVTIVKHEWHSHDRQYAFELDKLLLNEIISFYYKFLKNSYTNIPIYWPHPLS